MIGVALAVPGQFSGGGPSRKTLAGDSQPSTSQGIQKRFGKVRRLPVCSVSVMNPTP